MNQHYQNIDQLRTDYRRKRTVIRKRLADFRAIPAEDYFYELCYCLMTPQSSAINAAKAQRALAEAGFQNREVDAELFLHQRNYYIRFHKTKARLLARMKAEYENIFIHVKRDIPAKEKRDWLAEHVKGLGMKEATHFLRNVGMNDGFAILDRHILRNLKKHGTIRSLPKTLTKKKYLAIEKRFQQFATDIGIPIDELDLLFWSNETGEILK